MSSSPTTPMLDVAGIAVEVTAGSSAHAECIASRLGRAPSRGPADLTIDIGPDRPSPPGREPDQQLEGYSGWEVDDGVWIAQGDAALWVQDDSVVLGGPVGGPDEVDTVDNLLQFGIAIAVARPDRLMIHAAIVARDDTAIAVIGRSGAGKSTLAAAALLGGWDLLGDDLAVVHPGTQRVRSVQRPPMLPAEIADPHGVEGVREVGGRERVTLPVDVLRADSAHLAGVVAVAHGDTGGVERLPGGDPGVLDDALAVPPFRPVIRRQLAAAAAMVALPTFVLSHAADLGVRVARAQASLGAVLEEVGAQ